MVLFIHVISVHKSAFLFLHCENNVVCITFMYISAKGNGSIYEDFSILNYIYAKGATEFHFCNMWSVFCKDVNKTNTLGFGTLKASVKVGNNNVLYSNKYSILADFYSRVQECTSFGKKSMYIHILWQMINSRLAYLVWQSLSYRTVQSKSCLTEIVMNEMLHVT